MTAKGSARRLRVLMICPQFRPIKGGYERAAENLALALAGQGCNVDVVTERRNRDWPARERVGDVRVFRLWCVYRPGAHIATSALSLLGFLFARGWGYDVWHMHQYGLHAALVRVIGRLMGKPTVLKLTNTAENGIRRTLARERFPGLMRKLHLGFSAIAAISPESRGEAEAFGISPDRIHMLPNGVDTKRFRPRGEAERSGLKRILGLDGRPAVIFIGRLAAQKNPEGLMRAWQSARKELAREWVLVIVGDGPLRERLDALVEELGLQDAVLAIPSTEKAEDWLGACEICVLPSHFEGLSNVLLEAMATGLPVVTTRVSGVPELIEETKAGIVVDVADMGGVAEGLVRLALSPALREQMGGRGRQVVREGYSIEAVAADYQRLYRSLMKRGA